MIEDRCDVISLSPLAGDSPVAAAAQRICSEGGACQLLPAGSQGPHVRFKLPDTFDKYLGTLPKQVRGNFRRDFRRLSERYQVHHHVQRDLHQGEFFPKFACLHETQWRAHGLRGHFADWPDSYEFNRELVEQLATTGRVRFHQLEANDETLAMQYSFVLGDRCYWRLPARSPDPALEGLGLGRLGLVMMLGALMDEGVRTVEAGPAHYDYKSRHGGIELPLRRVVVSGRSLVARCKVRALLGCADLIHLVYYRMWYLRLAPRLGMSRYPLWRGWIRTRL